MFAASGGGLYHWYEIAGIIIAIPVAAAIVWEVIRVVRHLSLVHEAIIGRPATPFSDPIPSMIDRFHSVDDHLTQQDGRLATVEGQFRLNSGTTVKDDLVALRRSVARLEVGQARAATTAVTVATDVAQVAVDTAADLAAGHS